MSVCLSARGRMPTLLNGPGCNLGNGIGVPPSCALLGGSAIGARVAMLWQHSVDAKCHRVLYLLYAWFELVTMSLNLNISGVNQVTYLVRTR